MQVLSLYSTSHRLVFIQCVLNPSANHHHWPDQNPKRTDWMTADTILHIVTAASVWVGEGAVVVLKSFEPSRVAPESSPATPFASECCCCSWCVSDVGKLSPITIVPALQCRSVEANKKRKFLMRLKWKEFIFRIKLNLLKHFHLQPGK